MNLTYSFFDEVGRYLRSVSAPDMETVVLNQPEGSVMIEGEFTDAEYIKDGIVSTYPAPPGPDPFWVFDIGSEVWVDPRDAAERQWYLDLARIEATACINEIRGNVRSRYITILPGQDMVYMEKERLSAAFLADPDPDLADYQAIMAEVGPGLTGDTPYQVATVILNMADQWRALSAVIENISIRYLNRAAVEQDIELLRRLPEDMRSDLEASLSGEQT